MHNVGDKKRDGVCYILYYHMWSLLYIVLLHVG